MQQIAEWLERLGLGQYAQRFAENEIDVSVLPHLTDQDLKDIGIPLGHRRKILAAINEPATAAQAAPEPPAAPTAPKTADVAERRQVTVMFVDLVGSTELSARMDPEDLRDIISAYQKCIAETVRRFDGFVARYMGDGALLYFGYPEAHEDDPERAVRAGLALVSAVSSLQVPVVLQIRVGIATGVVIVGDLIGSDDNQEHDIVGETPNLAARLQAIARPDTVVIADGTRKLLGNLFDLQDLGTAALKGIQGDVRAWAAVRPRAVASRFEALRASALAPLVGREEELELLLRRWSRAKVGEGQVVLISGEAGIGKSRLTFALLEQLAREPHIRLRYVCSPQHTDSALYPIISQLMRAAALEDNDSPQAKLDKLDALLAQSSTSPEDAALIAELLSLSNDGRYPPVEVEPQLRRQKTLAALCSQLEALARISPVLMILEDAHWTDPTSLELFARLVDLAVRPRLLILVTFRPEFSAPWIGRSHVTALTLNRLVRREIDSLIQGVVGSRSLPTRVRQDIIERSDGVPLFVEEMTKAVLDAEGESKMQRPVARQSKSVAAVPASLQASLMSRLDRLGPAKDVAQVGAAIGREFSHMLLAAVARKPDAELNANLDRLVAAGLLFRQGTPPHASYLFKHALVQDAAYSTLLREPRRLLHARIAEILETQFAEVAESQPELLARHCTKANLIEKSAHLWGRAGQRSQDRSALAEAAEQLGQALAQIATLPSTRDLRREQIILQVALMNTLMHVKGYGAPETKAAVAQVGALIEQAERLGESPDDTSLLLSALFGQWIVNFICFDGDVARELAARFLEFDDRDGTVVPLIVGHRTMGSTLALVGDIVQARAHYDEALALYRPAEHRRLITRFGQDLRVTCLGFRSMALWLLGYPEAALNDADGALKEARQIDHAATLMFTMNFPILVNTYCGNYDAANGLLKELVALAEEKSAPFRKAEGVLRRGYILTLTGQAKAVEMVKSGIDLWRSAGSTIFTPEQEFMLAIAHADSGQFDDAWRCIDNAMAAMQATKERWCEAEVHRVAGEIELKSPQRNVAKAQAQFEHSLTLAQAQQAKSWELRSSMSLARLLRDQGERQAARDLLGPVRDWFTEGFDTSDLRNARMLLDELR
ncbi:adenylate/guanylate cyclase domain-containing protein [Bradyrhizobium sp. NP1]|uniref:ATP-binding protein n=1 Tax=Bradyrhizobium sp. NP1 TaxID=3049772 RepID=UPI0025A651EA|nr:adenylate/guanylate cyclase domain-containing protein [Bradyrhizobium sp. NP1]WJR75219.1 adenylate/guanylate cyclase domain-containing protein [Bradyrhizobium sp. NP1]